LEADEVDTYVLPFNWESLSTFERRCVEFAALSFNMPTKGTAPRLYAGLPDAENQIISALKEGWKKSDIRAAFTNTLNVGQFDYIYNKAYTNVYNGKAQLIRDVRRNNPNATPSQMIAIAGGDPTDVRLMTVATEGHVRTKTGNKKRIRGHHWGKRVTSFLRGLGEHASTITFMFNEQKEERKGLGPDKFRAEMKKLETQRKSINASYDDVLQRGASLLED
jgi:hypothetical protein